MTRTFIETVTDYTEALRSDSLNVPVWTSINYSKNNVFRMFLNVDLKKDRVFIPELCSCNIRSVLYSQAATNPSKEFPDIMSIILTLNPHVLVRKSFESIVSNVGRARYIHNGRLMLVGKNSEGDDMFIAGKGIIFDKDFRPLLVMGTDLILTTEDNSGTGEKQVIFTDKIPTCKIDRRVFEDPKSFVCKGIINKIIPALSTNIMAIHSYGWRETSCRIVIDSLDDMFTSPEKPDGEGKEYDRNLCTMIKNNFRKFYDPND